jgi:hypothetical protein
MPGSGVTEGRLAQMREEYWDTARVEGNTMIWEALKVAAEAMLEGNYALAQTILEASDIRTPSGTIEQAWDATGRLYQVPRYAFSNPSNINVGPADKSSIQHKGAVSTLSVKIRISASVDTYEQDIPLDIRTDQTMGDVKAEIHAALMAGRFDTNADGTPAINQWAGKGLPPEQQRLVFRGNICDDAAIVQAYGVPAGAFVQVFIRMPQMS